MKLLLNGEWIETGAWLPVTAPWTGAEIARVPLGDAATLESDLEIVRREKR